MILGKRWRKTNRTFKMISMTLLIAPIQSILNLLLSTNQRNQCLNLQHQVPFCQVLRKLLRENTCHKSHWLFQIRINLSQSAHKKQKVRCKRHRKLPIWKINSQMKGLKLKSESKRRIQNQPSAQNLVGWILIRRNLLAKYSKKDVQIWRKKLCQNSL